MKIIWQRRLPKALFITSLFGLIVNAHALEPESGYADSGLQLRFPAKLAELKFQRVMEFGEKKLGYCVLYAGHTSHGQFCVYDLGHENLPTGIESKEFNAALKTAVDGTLKFINTSPYRNGQFIGTGTPSVKADDKEAKAAVRVFTSEEESHNKATSQNRHLILMTTGLGKFLKFNYSAKNMKSDEFAEEGTRIIQEFVQLNGSAMKKLLVNVSK